MHEPPPLGRVIGCCAHMSMRFNDMQLRRAGYEVTPVQSHVLIYLSRLDEGQAANQRDLERELRLKPSTVNGIVNRLEEKGFITRQPSPTDGRCRLVSLTEAGQEKVNAFYAVMSGNERRLSGCLTEEEQDTLRELLSRIIENLENEVNNV